MNLDVLVQQLRKGTPQALAKAITLAETNSEQMRQLSQKLGPSKKRAHIIGITGPAGSGKSTVINSLVQELQKTNRSVGVIMIDPSSAFSGGAFLGDRMRMNRFTPEVFIRSITTKKHTIKLLRIINDIISLYEAFGKETIIIESTGSAREEIEIHHLVDTLIAILMPGAGDVMQAFKAGIGEVSAIFVVNKGDLEGIETTIQIIEAMLDLRTRQTGWRPPVLQMIATQDEGVTTVLTEINAHHSYLEKTNALQEKRQERTKRRLLQIVTEQLQEYLDHNVRKTNLVEALVMRVMKEELDVYEGAEHLLAATIEEFIQEKK